jgi:ribA/ribD-fused uncharacterized protein
MGKGPFVNGKEMKELGNYWPCSIVEDGKWYNSVEQYFQSKKCADQVQAMMMAVLTPEECAVYGQKVTLVPNWEEIKIGVMERAVRLKFEQNIDLRDLLCSTSPKRLFFCEKGKKQDWWDVQNERILTEMRLHYYL